MMEAVEKGGLRIVVAGPPGAGKTRLAVRLAARTGLPLYDLDDLYWGPGWSSPGPGEWQIRQQSVTGTDRWIIAGNFQATLDVRLRRATHLVVLDPGPAVCLARLVRRTLGIYLGHVDALPQHLRADGRFSAGRGFRGIARTASRYRRVELPATRRLAAGHGVRVLYAGGRTADAAGIAARLQGESAAHFQGGAADG
ncbi:hypothetical protein ACFQVC_09740 [Streptomyces monticola]|uniref:Adenylate kinase n=1 Tax=Streptomyces monticola TaxID=2666263 RepID=A0ABW2JGS1_9ACTN